MTNKIYKEIWVLEDEYIDRRIAGEAINIDNYCNKPYVNAEERKELRERLLSYEASQKGLESFVKKHVDSDAVWKRISARISKVVEIPRQEALQVAAEDSSHEEEIQSRLMHEFASKSIVFGVYSGSFLYEDTSLVSLVFRKGKLITTELDGHEVDIYFEDKQRETLQIQNGSVTIDFDELSISIQEYAEITFVIRKGAQVVGEGRLK